MSAANRRRWLQTALTGIAAAVPASAAIMVTANSTADEVVTIARLPSADSGRSKNDVTASDVVQLRLTDGTAAVITAMASHSAGGRLCVATDDDHLRLLRTADLSTIADVAAHRDRIRSIAFAPDGKRIASVGNDGRLVVWSIDDTDGVVMLSPIQTMNRTPSLARVAFSPDGGSIVAAGFTNTVYIMGSAGGGDAATRRIVCDHADLRAMDFGPDGRLAVAGRGGTVHLFDETQTGLRSHPQNYATAYQASKPTELIRAESNRSSPPCHCRTNPGSINDIAFAPGGNQLATVCDDGCVTLYDAGTDEIAKHVSIKRGRLFAIAVLDSHRVAVAGSDDSIRIVDFSTGGISLILTGHHGSVVDLVVVQDSLYSSGYDGTVRRWNIDRY